MTEFLLEALDCFGLYHDSTAAECRVCPDVVKCRQAMKGKKLQYVNATKATSSNGNTMLQMSSISLEFIEEALNRLECSYEKKPTTTYCKFEYYVHNEKYKKYMCIAPLKSGVRLDSKFPMPGAKHNPSYTRPYFITAGSEEEFVDYLAVSVTASTY